MQVLFRCIMQNPQVPACKACKMEYPFRDVPQFIPQLVPENLGKSKEALLSSASVPSVRGLLLPCWGYTLGYPPLFLEVLDFLFTVTIIHYII